MSDKPQTASKNDGAEIRCTLDRRELLLAGAGLGGTALLSGAPVPANAQAAAPVRLSVGDPSEYDFVNPTELDPAGPIDLKVTRKLKTIGRQLVELRNYEVKDKTGDELVGPTIRLRPGPLDTAIHLNINLINELDPEFQPPPSDVNTPHGFNTTNLHTHGLHVSPSDPQDNVLRKISPGESWSYAFEIPVDHQPGTFWYHAHKHGSTAVQVGNAMAGALIIEGDVDDVPEIRATKDKNTERIFVFQQIPYVIDTTRPGAPATVDGFPQSADFNDRNTTVNGVPNPTIRVRAGQVQRWRLIHAGIQETLELTLQRSDRSEVAPFYPIAIDGISLAQPDQADEPINPNDTLPTLGPGNRMDVLVKLEEGTYELLNGSPINLQTGETVSTQPLATIVVSADRDDMALPTRRSMAGLQRPKDLNRDISIGQTVVFAQKTDDQGNSCEFSSVDCKQFGEGDPRKLELGATEKWTVSAERGNVHPFHIHVNPFQVVQIGDESINPGVWWDTIIVTPGKPVTFLTHYEDFTGMTVLHCHNLKHEDTGMMQLVEIFET